MKTIEVTEKNFNDVVEKNAIVILDFWADWCGPCKMFAPVFEEVAKENPDVVFGKINSETEEDLSAAFNIRSIPTLMAFRDGILLMNQSGAVSKQALVGLIEQIKKLDMDKVRAEKKDE
ncbi:MAG: thioredoxin [Oligoflexia bacterium]|nr:thioredoxin [Oligoflexia bacterium]